MAGGAGERQIADRQGIRATACAWRWWIWPSMPGKPARTDVELLAGNDQVCWVRCTLHGVAPTRSGVHMAHLGHPLVADALYGGHPALGLRRRACMRSVWRSTIPRWGLRWSFTRPAARYAAGPGCGGTGLQSAAMTWAGVR